MKQLLNKLFEYKTLSREEAKNTLIKLAKGEYNNSQMSAFLTVFLMRMVTVEELSGFRDAMLELCVKVDLSDYDVMDIVGTGGDGKDTFNISTLSSVVVAAAGQSVAKHGNKSVSSVCGSSNVLDHLGYQFTNDHDLLRKSLDETNICFLHAPLFHPAMKNVAPVRGELGVKTFFNMLGPLVNPAFPKKQFLGVFNLEVARLYTYLQQQTENNFSIVYALDGYDEISLTGDFKVISNEGEKVYSPEDLGLPIVDAKALHGGNTVEEAAQIFMDILKGNGNEAQNAAIFANAGMALSSGKGITPKEGVEEAREALLSGKALQTFNTLVELSKSTTIL
ncbi:anthranilate phosphoribosyltransferase [Algivirga pacifica]|uniref:Anthranilate phosphoribosyltransferase n=1 Tax=Algivirga pacifica TaxID=1162670 RepID=A0ABP9DNY0_9BACT